MQSLVQVCECARARGQKMGSGSRRCRVCVCGLSVSESLRVCQVSAGLCWPSMGPPPPLRVLKGQRGTA